MDDDYVVIMTIRGNEFIPRLIDKPQMVYQEYEVYDSDLNKGFVVGNGEWKVLSILGDKSIAQAIISNSGGRMTIEYLNVLFELEKCYLAVGSDLENGIIKLRFGAALAV